MQKTTKPIPTSHFGFLRNLILSLSPPRAREKVLRAPILASVFGLQARTVSRTTHHASPIPALPNGNRTRYNVRDMSAVSDQLRQARESQKISVQQVAEVTKIRTDHLRALEEGNFDV